MRHTWPHERISAEQLYHMHAASRKTLRHCLHAHMRGADQIVCCAGTSRRQDPAHVYNILMHVVAHVQAAISGAAADCSTTDQVKCKCSRATCSLARDCMHAGVGRKEAEAKQDRGSMCRAARQTRVQPYRQASRQAGRQADQ